MLFKPSAAPYKVTLNSATQGNQLLVATSARQVIAILVTAGTGDIVVGIYDTSSVASLDPSNAVYVGANQGESFDWSPVNSIPFKNGVVINIEQGGTPFNGKVALLLE